MRGVTLNVVCVMAVLTQVGCRSVYRLRCTSFPPIAGVLVSEQMMGETPCTVTIPKNSELIRDDKVEMTFCLPDGREKTHVVDLHGLKPSNPLAEIVGMPFMLVGMGLILLSGDGDEDEDEEEDYPFATNDKKDKAGDLGMGPLGLGVMGAGAGRRLGGLGDRRSPRDTNRRVLGCRQFSGRRPRGSHDA